jgi:hypothetical protein
MEYRRNSLMGEHVRQDELLVGAPLLLELLHGARVENSATGHELVDMDVDHGPTRIHRPGVPQRPRGLGSADDGRPKVKGSRSLETDLERRAQRRETSRL